MSKTDWVTPLQHILNCPVQLATMSLPEWRAIAEAAEAAEDHEEASLLQPRSGHYVEHEGHSYLVIQQQDATSVQLLHLEGRRLTDTERALLIWTVQSHTPKAGQRDDGLSEAERLARNLSDWVAEQLESSEPSYMLPDHLTSGGRLFGEMIPFLLFTEYSSTAKTTFPELEKLLRSFLGDDILLIPLKSQEWLIWAPTSILRDADSDFLHDEEEESLEESLSSICFGLHEMLASEWIGECHLSVAHPVSPAQSLLETTIQLRETVYLGRKFHVGRNIHLPWLLHLERLLNSIPEAQRTRYVEGALKRTDLFVEPEILSTLETFFSLDCNVSETAKKLFIHRNTLLYRLDKLKQEAGLDVRQFRDAVLVKIILLLYKVTKRN
ncbi:PucR family transcriptional regulator [Paenibacillus sp. GCM10023252]|uniref:PucR family transcriptional regulator n=1 Tax=Paenibacillus sp. GCM10023252 TaxID=3252649 RepID=UPI00361C21C7